MGALPWSVMRWLYSIVFLCCVMVRLGKWKFFSELHYETNVDTWTAQRVLESLQRGDLI